jgi:hypothetical protein
MPSTRSIWRTIRLDNDADEALGRAAREQDRAAARQANRYIREGLERDGYLPGRNRGDSDGGQGGQ